MNQYNQNKVRGLGTRPEFEREMDFYVPVGVILVELKDCSDDVLGAEPGSSTERIPRKTKLLSKEEDFQQ
jgi:hypothetical protein